MKANKKKTSSITLNARRLLRFLARQREKISPLLIMTHDYPDPDALASAVTLQYAAEKVFGISSKIVYGGVIGRMENRGRKAGMLLAIQEFREGRKNKIHFGRTCQIPDSRPGI